MGSECQIHSTNQQRNKGLIGSISAMKGDARLAQSLGPQDIENMGVLTGFSSPPKAIFIAR
jgi:hypothetical protein